MNEANDKGYETTAHVSQLKIWRGFEDNESDENCEIESDIDDVNGENSVDNLDLDKADNLETSVNTKEQETEKMRSKREIRKPKYLNDCI